MVQTPQQILRSELLQLPMMLLEARLKLEVEENPVLEFDESGLDVEEDQAEEKEKKDDDEVDWEEAVSDDDNWDELINEDNTEFGSRQNTQSTQELLDIPRPQIQTLQEELLDQLQMDNRLSAADQRIGFKLIGNLEDSGYLGVTVEYISMMLEVEEADVLRVLKRMQRYDPIGIGSRDLRECLLVQLQALREIGECNELAYRILDEHYENFAAKRYEILARRLSVGLDEIKEAFLFISRLNPRPGTGEPKEKENYIIPDLVVEKVVSEIEDGSKEEEFVVSLVEGNLPSVRISRTYENMLRGGRNKVDKNVRDFIVRKVESARWFINAIQQRRETMLKVMRSIVKLQMEFFLYGREHIRPMILRDVAEDIEMDISTISRVTNRKYVQTEWGVFELKYFFSEGMMNDAGEDVSTKIIKNKLSTIVDNEDKQKPLSDQKIAEMLAEDGYKVARRT
ncbi:MAG: RNA polymerase factor sigma-54, partial [Candidatus Cloacimonetes bacterium]|nr:RNA polymerase factor sigma-54 [Candidatus Cloacimonadota bacterium]